MKIAVGLSGGIDSTATLLRLHEQKLDLVGITMKTSDEKQESGKCCTIDDIYDARQICQNLKIPHYIIDVKKQFHQDIIQYFIDSYLRGETPNPCLFCNSLVKFKYLIKVANQFGCNRFATGHYAILENSQDDNVILKKAKDLSKDQSYFLSQIDSSILRQCIFPLGNTLKSENVQYLKDRNIAIYKKKESYEICFVPGNNYKDFLKKHAPEKIKPGTLVNEEGNKIGTHEGIPFYTIGQRRGLNIAAGKPIYVRKMDAKTNTIEIGEKPYQSSLSLKQMNWLVNPECIPNDNLIIKVRYLHDGEKGYLKKDEHQEYQINFEKPVFSITKGQAAVGYDNDRVLFSGIIT